MHVIWSVLVFAMLGEMLVYFVAPAVYALTARVPFGPTRRIVLHPRAAEALRAPPREGGVGYRVSAMGEVDLGRLELPRRLDLDGLVVFFDLGRGSALARYAWSFGRKAYSFLRVDVVVTQGAIELRPRFIVLGWPSMIVSAPAAAMAVITTSEAANWGGAVLFGALFIGINVVVGLFFGKPRLEIALTEIERQIQAALFSAESAAR